MNIVRTSIVLGAVLISLGTPAGAADKLAQGSEKSAGSASGEVVAKVNGVGVSQADFDRNWEFFLTRSGIPENHAEKADEKTRQAGLAKAEDLLAQLKGGANFAELAKKSSDCPSAPQGGDLGFFGHGQMVPEFDEAAFALKPGEISGVVTTKFGYHIIKLEEKKDAGLVPEIEAAPRIREYLVGQKTGVAVEEKIKTLREKAKIEPVMNL